MSAINAVMADGVKSTVAGDAGLATPALARSVAPGNALLNFEIGWSMVDDSDIKMSPGDGSPATRLAHIGDPAERHGFVNPPVVHASTVLFPDLATLRSGRQRYHYGRLKTPTSEALESAITELEGAVGTKLAPSGLAAITLAMLAVVRAGDRVLVTDSCYGPTRSFCDGMLSRLGVQVDYYPPDVGGDIESLFDAQTRLVWTESPGSLTFEVQDIPAIAAACQRRGVLLGIDNTWATPLLFRPLAHGVDLSVMAATKYIVGHADAMLGTVAAGPRAWAALSAAHRQLGLCVGPDDIYLGLRGLRTLEVRLRQHHRAGLEVAHWLRQQPEVIDVWHPALPGAPGHALWARDFSGASGLFGVVLHAVDDAALAALLDGLRWFGMGYSWGGFESLVIPVDLSGIRVHVPALPADSCLLRFHIGLEDPADLIADLAAGFARMRRRRGLGVESS